jgi:hypothetical protein
MVHTGAAIGKKETEIPLGTFDQNLPAWLTDTCATLPSRTCCSQRAMSADESARDARGTSTAPRLLPLGVLVDAAEASDTLLAATLATAATRIGAAAAGLLVAAAAAVDCATTRAMVELQGTQEPGYVWM